MESHLNNQWMQSYFRLKKEYKIHEDKLLKYLQTPTNGNKKSDYKLDGSLEPINKLSLHQQYTENDKHITKYISTKIKMLKTSRSSLNDIQKMLRQTTDTNKLQIALEQFEQQLSKWKVLNIHIITSIYVFIFPSVLLLLFINLTNFIIIYS